MGSEEETNAMTTWQEYFDNVQLEGFEDFAWNISSIPRAALGASGGGHRASLSAFSVLSAFDMRNAQANGGAGTVGAILANDNTLISDVATKYININNHLLNPGDNKTERSENMANLTRQVLSKDVAGYHVSLVDIWAKDVSFHFLHNIENFGDELTLSSIANGDNAFTNHTMPFPLIVATVFKNGSATASVGTKYKNGTSVVDNVCVSNYDNLGFVTGTSSGYFIDYNGIAVSALTEIPSFLDGLSSTDALYMGDSIRLSDGGYAEGGVPAFSLAVPAREVDVIIILDNAGDSAWTVPNGDSVVRFSNYSTMQGIPFPDTPTKEEYIADPSLAEGIRFFGCHYSEVPTLVYIANQLVVHNTNQTTIKLAYQNDEIEGFMTNDHAILTQQVGFEDAPVCMACLFATEAGF
ncbi:hypothetical protein SARC_01644 [Sphaeroforma arctica JP610]|uniref:PLA2c domain-containing protein n=1 Tax=Sphaeroforma arctica JP610 TaxID=667725 RepID=A0A0L0GB11_9EUKA|nr:hypothetical protein SARC_01644 [Sphaeroforma arctica JP610]KNC86207.1 hypothetical protein SARC_01644 [Sphaeroforma arctica JP610]|eukprot:XP_014160109.1 hypothetical protein SARC_01644 [Sphaeroforma arctica JP610]